MNSKHCLKTANKTLWKGSRTGRFISVGSNFSYKKLIAYKSNNSPYISLTEGLPNGSKTQTTLNKMMGIYSGLERLIAQAMASQKYSDIESRTRLSLFLAEYQTSFLR